MDFDQASVKQNFHIISPAHACIEMILVHNSHKQMGTMIIDTNYVCNWLIYNSVDSALGGIFFPSHPNGHCKI